MLAQDPLKNVLYIDLSKRKFWIEPRPELFEEYLGGVGVGAALLEEECPEGVEPFSPEAPIILAVGPMVGFYPMASKTAALFKSPHTGNLGESHAGGRSAVSIRLAGLGAIVIKGASDIPIAINISENKVSFIDARALWGLGVGETGRILREKTGKPGARSIFRIGLAGENLSTFACVVTETYRHFGRLGLGAVFGSKKLKALVITGHKSLPVADKKAYHECYDKILKQILETDSLKKYHDLGTAVNVLSLNRKRSLPTKNLTQAWFEEAEKISGEYFAEHLLGRRLACAHCPVACIHLAALRIPYEDEPYFYKTSFISYDYELIYSLGSMLGVGKAEGILKILAKVDDLGLDAISAGVVLAWATEAFEKGLIGTKETLGLSPTWGAVEVYLEMLEHLARQSNEFYQTLAKGVEHASQRYGGEDFALAFGKNEMPGYHTGYGCHLGFLTGARHSHLDSAGYSYDQKLNVPEIGPEKLAELLFEEEAYRQILSSIIICFFARSIYKYEVISEALKAIGYDFSPEELKALGQRILRRKYHFKLREGFSFEDLRIPKRILKTISPHGQLNEEFLRRGIETYKEILLKERL